MKIDKKCQNALITRRSIVRVYPPQPIIASLPRFAFFIFNRKTYEKPTKVFFYKNQTKKEEFIPLLFLVSNQVYHFFQDYLFLLAVVNLYSDLISINHLHFLLLLME